MPGALPRARSRVASRRARRQGLPARSSAGSSAACGTGRARAGCRTRLDGDRPAADLGAGRHHQFPHLRSRPAAARLRRREARRRPRRARRRAPARSLAALNGRTYALDPTMTVIADNSRRAEPRRRHRRRGHRLHRGDHRRLYRGRAVRSRAHRRHRPQAQSADRRALSLRARRSIPPSCGPASRSATRLILELCGGEPSEIAQAGAVPDWRRHLRFRPDRTRSLGGIDIGADEQRRILESARLHVVEDGRRPGRSSRRPGAATSRARPIWSRKSCASTATSTFPSCRCRATRCCPSRRSTPAQRRAGFVRRSLAARGLVEAVTYSFMPRAQAELFGGVRRRAAPRQSDQRRSRRDAPSLLPNLLAAAQAQRRSRLSPTARCSRSARNIATTRPRARRPWPPACAPAAPAQSAGTIRAARSMRSWPRPTRWRRWRRRASPAESLQIGADPPAWYHPGRAGSLRLGPKLLALFGEIHPAIVAALRREGPAAGFEIFLDAVPLPRARGKARPLLKLSPFQPVERDFAFVVPQRPAGRDLAARGARRRQEARRRGAALRRLCRPGRARGQEIARHHRRAPARGGDA